MPDRLNSAPPSAIYMRQWIGSALFEVMACRLFGAKWLSEKPIWLILIGPLGNFNENLIKKNEKKAF